MAVIMKMGGLASKGAGVLTEGRVLAAGGGAIIGHDILKEYKILFTFPLFVFYSSEIRFSMSLRYFFRILLLSLVISINLTPIPAG